jgi:NHS family xanthosine MFS transporter
MGIKIDVVIGFFSSLFGAWLITVEITGWDKDGVVPNLGLCFQLLRCVNADACTGIIADRWINARKIIRVLHIQGSFAIFYIPEVDNPTLLLGYILAMMFYI